MQLKQIKLLLKYVNTFDLVKDELKKWESKAKLLPDELREQALLSIKNKAFHCLGGSIYALYPGVKKDEMITAIVALQTISDYLDNLCDRMNVYDDQTFMRLHESFLDALEPTASVKDYYSLYPLKETIYLPSLVYECQNAISNMPLYELNKPKILELASYYCKLQALKHTKPDPKKRVKTWIEDTFTNELFWNEWAAATGSTLGIFMLFALSYSPDTSVTHNQIFEAYFPWIQGLHILLDYFIDQAEDHEFGDLNFCADYESTKVAVDRLNLFYQVSKQRIAKLKHPYFHDIVIKGLLAMYGSDPKLSEQGILEEYKRLLRNPFLQLMYRTCLKLRKRKELY